MHNAAKIRTCTGLVSALMLLGLTVGESPLARAQAPIAANDNLNATLWTQTSVEFKANALVTYKLAEVMLDRALADKSWTAALEQAGSYQDLPPAVILDVDETVLDNSAYQAWRVKEGVSFQPATWGAFVNTASSRPVPGSREFISYAASQGVTIFYVSNRNTEFEVATRKNLAAYGYPLDDTVDTVLLQRERQAWGAKKGSRRAVVAETYRILLLIGDNFGDFVDAYKDTPEARQKLMDAHKSRWGTQWIVISNPTYGSWEAAPFGFNHQLSEAEKRAEKLGALRFWEPK